MGGDVNLTKAPNGAIARAEVLATAAKILYLEGMRISKGTWDTTPSGTRIRSS